MAALTSGHLRFRPIPAISLRGQPGALRMLRRICKWRCFMLQRLKNAWLGFRLLTRTNAAFRISAQGDDAGALKILRDTKEVLGPFTQYPFGIEAALLEIFSQGCVEGLRSDDYDLSSLKQSILCAPEYSSAEKLHLILYLEEMAATAGVTLSAAELVGQATPGEFVNHRLLRRFPKLSEA